jgi:hypothetical protein
MSPKKQARRFGGLVDSARAVSGVTAGTQRDPEACPPDCGPCAGVACLLCGAERCEHDWIERHTRGGK